MKHIPVEPAHDDDDLDFGPAQPIAWWERLILAALIAACFSTWPLLWWIGYRAGAASCAVVGP